MTKTQFTTFVNSKTSIFFLRTFFWLFDNSGIWKKNSDLPKQWTCVIHDIHGCGWKMEKKLHKNTEIVHYMMLYNVVGFLNIVCGKKTSFSVRLKVPTKSIWFAHEVWCYLSKNVPVSYILFHSFPSQQFCPYKIRETLDWWHRSAIQSQQFHNSL